MLASWDDYILCSYRLSTAILHIPIGSEELSKGSAGWQASYITGGGGEAIKGHQVLVWFG